MSYVTKTEEAKEEIKRQIIDCAKTLFYERGFEQVAMHDIAKEVGITPRTIHKLFVNKTDVFYAILASIYEEMSIALLLAGYDRLMDNKQNARMQEKNTEEKNTQEKNTQQKKTEEKKTEEKAHADDTKEGNQASPRVVELLEEFLELFVKNQAKDYAAFYLLLHLGVISKQIDPVVLEYKNKYYKSYERFFLQLQEVFVLGINQRELRRDLKSEELALAFFNNLIGFVIMFSHNQVSLGGFVANVSSMDAKENHCERDTRMWDVERKFLMKAVCNNSISYQE